MISVFFLGEKLSEEEIESIVHAYQNEDVAPAPLILRDTSLSYSRAVEIARDYINNDFEGAAETAYVRDILYDNLGCTDEELEALGLSYLIKQEEEE